LSTHTSAVSPGKLRATPQPRIHQALATTHVSFAEASFRFSVPQIRLADVRPAPASQSNSEEADKGDRIRILHGTPISELLQKYFNGTGTLASTYVGVTKDTNFDLDSKLVTMMEDLVKELETSDLKPRERYLALEKFMYQQSLEFSSHAREMTSHAESRADAMKNFLAVIGLSVLVSLVLALLDIESNTRNLLASSITTP